MKRLFFWALLGVWCVTISAQNKQLAVLSVNDMHANLDYMPRLAAMVDSLRTIYPDMLVFSAGDNRTGNPFNDMYATPALPMTMLMNAVGFNASAVGNHEWDSGIAGFRTLINQANFRHLCANANIPDTMRLHLFPYHFFKSGNVRVGVLGCIQIGANGIPDTHPKNVQGITFTDAADIIPQYAWMRQQCDVFILLSHTGYEADTALAKRFPFFDAIIGGHTHTRVEGTELHNGVLVTQAENRLKWATLSIFTLDNNGHIIDKQARLLNIQTFNHEKQEVKELLNTYNHNDFFERQIGTATRAFLNAEELGCFMADAIRFEYNADIALQNYGGVRRSTFPAGPITVKDILELDPFGNEVVEFTLTGEEVYQLLLACQFADDKKAPYVSGITYEMTFDKNDITKVTKLVVRTEDGRKLDLKKKYKVLVSSYVAAICKYKHADPGHNTFQKTSDVLMNYIEKKKNIDYQGVTRIKWLKK